MSESATIAELEQIAGCLEGELKPLLGVLAAEFGAITGKLQGMAGEARQVAALCRETAGVLLRQEVDQGIVALRSGLGACDVKAMGECSNAVLHGVAAGLEGMRPLLTRLRSRPVVLHTVSLLSRIEQGRLDQSGVDAFTLSADIEELAEEIAARSGLIDREVDILTPLVEESCKQLTVTEEGQERESSELLEESEALLAQTERERKLAAEVILGVERSYAEIQRMLEGMVVSLQTEDITRQRIEHIGEALRGMAAGEVDRGEQVALLALERHQLAGVRELVKSSLSEVGQALSGVGERVEALLVQMRAVSGSSSGDATTMLCSRLGALSKLLGEYADAAEKVTRIVDAVTPSVAEMTRGAAQLEAMRFTIRLTALNARIETFRMGARGATMQALSWQVQEIAESSGEDTRAILACLHAMDATLGAASCTRTGEIVGGLRGLQESIAQLTVEAAEREEQAARSMAQLAERGACCLGDLSASASSLEKGARRVQVFDRLIEDFDRHLRRHGGDALPRDGEALERLASLYSMHAEREIHRCALAGDGSYTAAEEGEFGENVELF